MDICLGICLCSIIVAKCTIEFSKEKGISLLLFFFVFVLVTTLKSATSHTTREERKKFFSFAFPFYSDSFYLSYGKKRAVSNE